MKKIAHYPNGNILSYADYGDINGFPILIQHGMIASIEDYDLFEILIELGTHLICIARPGYGDSSPYLMRNIAEWGEIISAVVDEFKLSVFDVLGLSSGAPYSYAIGQKFPDQVRNIFILSGTPALYDEKVQSFWPYPLNQGASLTDMQKLAHVLFFSGLSQAELASNAVRDSMSNDCFGVAQDLLLRVMDWGFRLQDVHANVFMRHSRADEAVPFVTAELTSKMLPGCKFEAREADPHFSQMVLDDFIRTLMAGWYVEE